MNDKATSSLEKKVYVLTGDGRGKTSAAMGQVLLAASHKLKTCVVFFMKAEHELGEYKALSSLPGVHRASFGRAGFLRAGDMKGADIESARKALDYALAAVKSAEWDLIVLDEINNARHYGQIDVDDIVTLIAQKPEKTALILTGKYVDERVAGMADFSSHFKNIKHPYDSGILARKGFDY
jgi:cob(I)alamin adenosyltransferase